jgi:hypothetical protein
MKTISEHFTTMLSLISLGLMPAFRTQHERSILKCSRFVLHLQLEAGYLPFKV